MNVAMDMQSQIHEDACQRVRAPASRIHFIVSMVSAEMKIPVWIILDKDRHRKYARARQIISWLARQTTGHSFPSIGRQMERDHTTIISGCKVVTRLRETDPAMLELTDRLLLRLVGESS